MTIFGYRFLDKLNEWWREEYVDMSVCFVEDNATILVQTDYEYIGIVYWVGADVLSMSLHPTYEHQQTIKLFLIRTLSAFLCNVAILSAPTDTYNI